VVDVTGESVPGKVSKAIVKAAIALGYVSNRHFVSKCAMLWSMMADPAASVVAIADAVSEGKSAVRDTVLKALKCSGISERACMWTRGSSDADERACAS
jgi:hypothetical protein